jgi:outer membrane immunogenic protein
MRRFRCATLAALATYGLTSIASAADLPTKAPAYKASPPVMASTWAGFYVGGNVGGVWSSFDPLYVPDPAFFPGTGASISAASTGAIKTSGIIAGGQFGYNWQFAPYAVFGIEADLNYTGIDRSRTVTIGGVLAGLGTFETQTVQSQWLSTVRGRLGYAAGNVLIYGTGGLAVAEINYSDVVRLLPLASNFHSASSSITRTGWTAGAGVEWKFAPSWSVKAEYLYVGLGDATYVSPNNLLPAATIQHQHNNFHEDIARLGLNYHFSNAPVVARY